MNTDEKLIDSMGQCVFRLETNFVALLRRIPKPDQTGQDAVAAMFADLEKLKAIKTHLADGPLVEQLQAARDFLPPQSAVKQLAEACELIIAVKHCMMFEHIHADWIVKEVLDKHGVPSIQLLAKKAQDTAEHAVEIWNQQNKKRP